MRFIPDMGQLQDNVDVVLIDAIDRKLLLELSANARASIVQLSKKCRVSRDTVSYRLNKLTQQKVLVGTRALADANKLGFDSYHLFLKLRNPTTSVEQKMIAQISKLSYVRAVIKFFGKFDYEIALVATSVIDFDERLTQIIEHVGSALQSYEVLAITKNFVARSFPKSFGENSFVPNILGESQKLDDVDIALLQHISENARESMVSISAATKTPVDTLIYRLKKLQGWLISGYTPVINYAALGYTMYAVLLDIAQLSKSKESMLKEFLQKHKHILWAVKTIGTTNILIYVCVKTEQEYHDTISDLRNTFPEQIRGFESLSAVAQYKYTLVPQVLFESKK